MKVVFGAMLFATMMIGCGEGAPPEMTPEEKAKSEEAMNSEMENMQNMMNQAPPEVPSEG